MRRLGTLLSCLVVLCAGAASAATPAPAPVRADELPQGLVAVQAACGHETIPRPGWEISPATASANHVGPPGPPLGTGSRWISAATDSVPGLAVELGSALDFADVAVSAFQTSELTYAIDVTTVAHGRFRLRQEQLEGTGWPWVGHRTAEEWTWQGATYGAGTLAEFVSEYGDAPATGYIWAGDCDGGGRSYPNPTSVDALTYGSGSGRTTIDFEPAPSSVSLSTGPMRPDGSRALSCELRDRDGHRLPDQLIVLAVRPWSGTAEPEWAADAVTDSRGVASFRVRPRVPTRYRCEFGGSALAPATSSWTTRLRPAVTAVVARRGGAVRVRGAAIPATRGTPVVLHVRHGGHASVVRGRLRAHGRYSLRAQLPAGRTRVWVSVASGPGTTAARSKAFTVRRP